MSVLILPRRFKSQPQYAPQLDYPGLAKGVRIIFNPAVGPVDLATGRSWERGGSAGLSAASKGIAFSFEPEGDYYGLTGYPEITGNIGTFFLWCPTVGAPDINGHIVFGSSTPLVCAYRIQENLTIGIGSNGGSVGTLSSWFNTSNRSLILVSGGTAETCKSFLDGKDTGQTWANAPSEWGAGDKNFNLGRYVGGTGFQFKGTVLIAGYTDAVWGAAESEAFHDNPWQIFKAPSRRLWVVPRHELITSNATQSNTLSTGVVAQTHILSATSALQANNLSTGAIYIPVIASNLTQSNILQTGVLSQTHAVTANNLAQANSLSLEGISQTHILASTNLAQATSLTSGVISVIFASIWASDNSASGRWNSESAHTNLWS